MNDIKKQIKDYIINLPNEANSVGKKINFSLAAKTLNISNDEFTHEVQNLIDSNILVLLKEEYSGLKTINGGNIVETKTTQTMIVIFNVK